MYRAGSRRCCRVLFPATAGAQTSETPHEPRSEQFCSGAAVLVVDDEEIVRRIAQRALEKSGCRVLVAENGQIAVDVFAREADEIALVLLDLTMPVMNGEQTFHRLQRIRPGVKVILMSGYDEADAMSRFRGGGLAGFLQKPYTAAKLSEIVRRVPESPAARAPAGFSPGS